MRILVYDIAASEGGALTVLNEFYQQVCELDRNDIQWLFVLSTPQLSERVNIRVLRYPWTKKSWIHRWVFDHFYAKRIIQQYKIDRIFSLQDIRIPVKGLTQFVCLHDSLPFVNYRYKITENLLLWLYQNPIAKLKYRSIITSDKTIVQSRWMVDACVQKTGADPGKIAYVPMNVDMSALKTYQDSQTARKTFFYPAFAFPYKNHRTLLKACKLLNKEEYQVILTINGEENKYSQSLKQYVMENDLNVLFFGRMKREEVFEWYTKSVLVFPSYIEAYGLPIDEARRTGTFILSTSCPFSADLLEGYGNARFFEPFDEKTLAEHMRACRTAEYLPDSMDKTSTEVVLNLAETVIQ